MMAGAVVYPTNSLGVIFVEALVHRVPRVKADYTIGPLLDNRGLACHTLLGVDRAVR